MVFFDAVLFFGLGDLWLFVDQRGILCKERIKRCTRTDHSLIGL